MYVGAHQWLSGFTTALFLNFVSSGHWCDKSARSLTIHCIRLRRGKSYTLSILCGSTYTSRCQVKVVLTVEWRESKAESRVVITTVVCIPLCGKSSALPYLWNQVSMNRHLTLILRSSLPLRAAEHNPWAPCIFSHHIYIQKQYKQYLQHKQILIYNCGVQIMNRKIQLNQCKTS